jgi:NADH dehydrogenase
MSLLPVMPIPGDGRTPFQPMWSEDVADCVMSVLSGGADGPRYELAGPETLTHRDIVRITLDSLDRRRPIVGVPQRIVRRGLNALELVMGPTAFATWDEAELLDIPMVSRRGTADAEALGVVPRSMRAVLVPASPAL